MAFFWIVLAGFSALYLFTLFGDPTAFGGQTAKLGTTFSSSGLTADQASQVIEANEARDKEVAEIKATMRELSQQVSDLSARVEPARRALAQSRRRRRRQALSPSNRLSQKCWPPRRKGLKRRLRRPSRRLRRRSRRPSRQRRWRRLLPPSRSR